MERFLESTPTESVATSEKMVAKKRKRSNSTLDEEGQPAEKYLELAQIFTLDRFCDEVLIEIFKYLDTNAILSLESTCIRFSGLVKDYRLWNEIDLMTPPRPLAVLRAALEKAHKNTTVIKIRSTPKECNEDNSKRQCILKNIIPKCQNLVDLELESVFVDFSELSIQDFPKNLKRLAFRHLSVLLPEGARSIFKKIDRSLIWLEELCVESCEWFHPYDIMLFSKCPSLKKLSLKGCHTLSDFVPYGSMASRFGFKSLEFLDVRDTPITDSDLQCFNAILTLKELLLECPPHLRITPPIAQNTQTVQDPTTTQPSTSSSASTSTQPSTSPSRTSGNVPGGEREVFFELIPEAVGRCGAMQIPRGLSNVVVTINLTQNLRPIDRTNGNGSAESPNRRIPNQDGSPDHFNRILRSPQFWDIIDGQPNISRFGPCSNATTPPSPITNRGISCFGRPANPVDRNIIWIRIGNRPTDNSFERLCLRHYKRVTDDSLKHLVQCSPNLVYLDVTGTGVTEKGITDFKAGKPNCEVICENIEN